MSARDAGSGSFTGVVCGWGEKGQYSVRTGVGASGEVEAKAMGTLRSCFSSLFVGCNVRCVVCWADRSEIVDSE